MEIETHNFFTAKCLNVGEETTSRDYMIEVGSGVQLLAV